MSIQETKEKIEYSIDTFHILMLANSLLLKRFKNNKSKYSESDSSRFIELIDENKRICEPHKKYSNMLIDAFKDNSPLHHFEYLAEKFFRINASLIFNTKLIKKIVNKYDNYT